MPTIRIEIDQFGQPTIKAEGYKGAACKAATASLEAAYSAGASKRTTPRPEMFNATTDRATVTAAGPGKGGR